MKLDVTFTDGDLNNTLDFDSDQSLLGMDLTDEIGEGTKNYVQLKNKPQINGVTLTGNKTGTELGLVNAVEGKGLSTNDYTNEDQDKVQNLPSTEEFDSSIETIEKEIDDLEEFKMGLTTESELTPSFENGSLDARDGIPTTVDSTIRLRSGYYEIEPDCGHHVTLPSGLTFKWFAYNGTTPETFVDVAPDWISESTMIQHSNGKYIRLLVAKTNDGTIAPSDAAGISVTVYRYTDETLTQSGKAADAEIVGDFLRGVYPQNTIEDVAIASFDDGADNIPVKALTVGIEPVQDLHGYANPWPAGGGKNKLHVTTTTQTINGVAFTVADDGTITANGTASAEIQFAIGAANVSAGTNYVLTGCPSGGGTSTYRLMSMGSSGVMDGTKTDTGSGVACSALTDGTALFRIVITSGVTVSNLVFEPMLRLATEADSTFAPYSNICPISGWTGAEVTRTGKNLWDEEIIVGGYYDNTGVWKTKQVISAKNYIPVEPGVNVYVHLSATAPESSAIALTFWDANKTFLSRVSNKQRSMVQIPDNCYYLMFNCNDLYGTTYNNDISINYPATDTEYHEGNVQTLSVTFPVTIYGGDDEVVSGKLKKTMSIVDLGELPWNADGASIGKFRTPLLGVVQTMAGRLPAYTDNFICSTYKSAGLRDYTYVADGAIFYTNGGVTSNIICICDSTKAGMTAEEFKAAMSGIQLCYELADPTEYTLTPQTLPTLHGTNNIWADCGDIQKLTYYKDPTIHYGEVFTEPIEVLNEKASVLEETISDPATGLGSKAPAIMETVGPAAIASFDDGADSVPVKKLVAKIEPVQDLHGYANPWPAGGGTNQWDEEWLNGRYNSSTGIFEANSAYFCSKNRIQVVPGNTYYIFTGSITNVILWYYDGSGDYLSQANVASGNWTAPNDVSYIQFSTPTSYGTTYNHDIAINYPSTVTTYSPYSNICPISGWTGAEIEQAGVNVWDEEWEVGSIDATTGQNTNSTSIIRAKNYTQVKSGESYYFSVGTVVNSVWLYYYKINKDFISASAISPNTVFTIPEECGFIRFRMLTAYGTTYNNDISINYPATDTEYHPYIANQISVTFPAEAGTVYGGMLDAVTGELTVTYAKDSKTWGSLQLVETLTVIKRKRFDYSSAANITPRIKETAICNVASYNQSSTLDDTHFYTMTAKVAAQICLPVNTPDSTVIEICYPLDTPIVYQLDPITVSTLFGINNIWADTGDVEVTYPADTKAIVDTKADAVKSEVSATQSMLATVETTSAASKSYAVGDILVYNNQLYKVVSAIPAGAMLTPGTNIVSTTVDSEIRSRNDSIVNNLSQQISDIKENDIEDLNRQLSDHGKAFGTVYKNISTIPEIKAYDKSLNDVGHYLKADGTIGSATGWNITALMPIVPSAKYYAYGILSSTTVKSAYFDANGDFISGSAFTVSNSNQWKSLENIPTNAVYVRFSVSSNIVNAFQYNFAIDIVTYPQNIAGRAIVQQLKDTLIPGEYYTTSGGIGTSPSWYRSKFIPVQAGDYIESSNAYSQWLTLFNENGVFEGTVIATTSTTYTVESGIAYIGLNVLAANVDTFDCKVNGISVNTKYNFGWMELSGSIWSHKTYISHGDSITWQDGKAYTQGEHIGEIAKGYQTVFSDAVGLASYNNQGKSGWSMAVVNGNGVVNTIMEISDYAVYDLCTIACGTNDFKLNVPIGTQGVIGDTTFDDTTFFGAYRKAVEYILTNSPTIRIVLMTPLQRDNAGYDVDYTNSAGAKLIDYVNAVKVIGDMYGLPVCDMYTNSGFTKKTLSTYTMDGLHPNDVGYQRMGGYLTGFLNAVGT